MSTLLGSLEHGACTTQFAKSYLSFMIRICRLSRINQFLTPHSSPGIFLGLLKVGAELFWGNTPRSSVIHVVLPSSNSLLTCHLCTAAYRGIDCQLYP